MASPVDSLLIGVFERGDQAIQAYEELRREGFAEEDLGIAAPERRQEGTESESPAVASLDPQGVGIGGGLGALLGGMAGGGIALAIPGIGPVVAGGLFALTGGSLGALAGSFFGLSVPEEESRYYKQQLQAGNTLLAVRAANRRNRASQIMESLGGHVRAEQEPHPFSPGTDQTSGPGTVET